VQVLIFIAGAWLLLIRAVADAVFGPRVVQS